MSGGFWGGGGGKFGGKYLQGLISVRNAENVLTLIIWDSPENH